MMLLLRVLRSHFIDIYDPERRAVVRVILTLLILVGWGIAIFS